MHESDDKKPMSAALLFLMTVAIAATAANLFYNQPLLPSIADTFGLNDGAVGLIPFASQLGYAAAILFISPLGDTLSRRTLIACLSVLLAGALLAVFTASGFGILLVACFAIGLGANITQQLIPFGASLSTLESRGKVMGTLMTGLTVGILLSRTISGSIAEYFGWRSVFLVAAFIMTAIGILLYRFLPSNKPTLSLSYPRLLLSLYTLVKQHASLRESAFTGALWFAAFNALWSTLAIHVTAAPLSYSVQQAGLFGLVGLAGIAGARVSGRLVGEYGAERLIAASLLLVVSAFVVMGVWGDTLAGLVVGIVLLDVGVFGAQVPNQVRVFSIDPSAHSRINAIYMLCYFVGAALGSVIGVKVMSLAGWHGLILFGSVLAVTALTYHLWHMRSQPLAHHEDPAG